MEDNEVNREIAVEMLLGVGLEVETASDGVEALERVGSSTYDLILMDMQMPRLDGPGACRAIRTLTDWATRPILALTANAFGDDRTACLSAGMDAVITKPVMAETLYTALLQWLPAPSNALFNPDDALEPQRPVAPAKRADEPL